MHLLGRAQARPAPLLYFGARYKKTRSSYYVPGANASSGGKKQGQAVVQRDAQGRPIVKARERSAGTFRPLAAGSLTHELFESAVDGGIGRVELDVPPMLPRLLAPGVATRFHDMDATSPLRVYGVPKHMLLEFRLLGMPVSITTSTTLSLIRALEEAKSQPARLVLNGRAGVGKSFLLLQAAQYAASTRQWIVLYIPRPRTLVDGSSPYQYSLATRTYLQPRIAAQTLSRLLRANAHILDELETGDEIVLPDGGAAFPVGTSLPDLIHAGIEADGVRAPFVLEAVMDQLAEQEHYPVLIAIDDFQALTGRSLYRDPRFKMVRPHHLSMPRLLLEYVSGRKQLARGLVLTALSRTNTQFPVTPQLADALSLSDEFTPSPTRGRRYRRSSQLAKYLETEIEEPIDPPAYPPSSDADAWTGYTAYDPPVYEDALKPTAADPFPVARPAGVWRGKIVQEGVEEAVPDEDSDADDGVATGEVKGGKKKNAPPKKAKATTRTVRALRAVRVPDALSVREAAGLFEVWMDAGVLRTGGQRRAARRAELDTLKEYRKLKAEVDADPETAYDAALADADSSSSASSASSSPFASSASASAPTAQGTKKGKQKEKEKPKKGFADFASAVQSKTFPSPSSSPSNSNSSNSTSTSSSGNAPAPAGEHTIAALRAELDGPEYDEVRALEAAAEMQVWDRRRQREGLGRVWSIDGRVAGEGEAEGVEVEGVEEIATVEAETDSAEDDFVRAAEALGEGASASAPGVSKATGPLDLGSDPEIARIVSAGVRAALTNPASLGGPQSEDAEIEEQQEQEQEENEEAEEEEQEDEDEDEDLRVQEESGADELFLGKYTESSGNARAFVGGLVGTLQTSG